jgi:hypothetical protein
MSKEEFNEEERKLGEDPSLGIVSGKDILKAMLKEEEKSIMSTYVGSWEAWEYKHGRIF